MKVAISSRGQTLDSMVEPRFGRCNWFVVVDIGNGEHSAYSNDSNFSWIKFNPACGNQMGIRVKAHNY